MSGWAGRMLGAQFTFYNNPFANNNTMCEDSMGIDGARRFDSK